MQDSLAFESDVLTHILAGLFRLHNCVNNLSFYDSGNCNNASIYIIRCDYVQLITKVICRICRTGEPMQDRIVHIAFKTTFDGTPMVVFLRFVLYVCIRYVSVISTSFERQEYFFKSF